MSLTINESGLEADETMTVYKMACTEAESAKVVAGATVTVGGKLQNYYNQSKDTHTYEFTSPVLLAVDDGQGGGGGGQTTQALVADFSAKTVKHNNYGDTWEYGDFTLAGAANNNGGWAFVKFGPKSATLSGDGFPGVWMKTKGAMEKAISAKAIVYSLTTAMKSSRRSRNSSPPGPASRWEADSLRPLPVRQTASFWSPDKP